MFCRKGLYLKLQKIHHKTLKVIYQSNKTYEELLELSETVSIRQRHLVTEVYKSTSYLNPRFMWYEKKVIFALFVEIFKSNMKDETFLYRFCYNNLGK